jgi:hypothetical protein
VARTTAGVGWYWVGFGGKELDSRWSDLFAAFELGSPFGFINPNPLQLDPSLPFLGPCFRFLLVYFLHLDWFRVCQYWLYYLSLYRTIEVFEGTVVVDGDIRSFDRLLDVEYLVFLLILPEKPRVSLWVASLIPLLHALKAGAGFADPDMNQDKISAKMLPKGPGVGRRADAGDAHRIPRLLFDAGDQLLGENVCTVLIDGLLRDLVQVGAGWANAALGRYRPDQIAHRQQGESMLLMQILDQRVFARTVKAHGADHDHLLVPLSDNNGSTLSRPSCQSSSLAGANT